MNRIVLCFLLFATTLSFTQDKPKAKPTAAKPYTCVAGPDEVCASDLWYADYLKFKALGAKYVIPQEILKKYQMPQDVQDQIKGWGLRLASAAPKGFDWSEEKQRWVKIPVQQVAQPAPAEKK